MVDYGVLRGAGMEGWDQLNRSLNYIINVKAEPTSRPTDHSRDVDGILRLMNEEMEINKF